MRHIPPQPNEDRLQARKIGRPSPKTANSIEIVSDPGQSHRTSRGGWPGCFALREGAREVRTPGPRGLWLVVRLIPGEGVETASHAFEFPLADQLIPDRGWKLMGGDNAGHTPPCPAAEGPHSNS